MHKQNIYKSVDAENHFVTFVCMVPDQIDAHGDVTDAEEIRKACINFNKSKSVSPNLCHMFKTDTFEIVESYTLPVELSMQDVDGTTRELPKGTWLVTLEVNDARIWDSILKGSFNGVSIGARGKPVELGESDD